MKYMTRYALVLLIGVFVGAGVTLEQAVLAEREAKSEAQASSNTLPLDDLRAFTEVFNRIKTDYVVDVDDKKLLQDAIQGMLSGLDPHSGYLDQEGFKEIRIGTEGEFGGLGIEVSMEDGFVKVVSPIEDTPAFNAGIKPGDVIIRLDEKPVKGMNLTEAVKLMRGKPGSSITLTVLREGQPVKVTLTRAIIKIKSVKSRLLEDGYGYVRITQFQSNTGENLVGAVKALKKDNKAPLKGLILDMRNNPGGVLNSAISVSDAFLSKGRIVSTNGRVPDSQLKFDATPNDIVDGAPIIVLVNGGSASASEIVAGALQDHKRAIVMGTKTFGKGSVQTIVPMSNGGALKLTTARYYTPSGRSIQATGVTPDITVAEARLTLTEKDDLLREADLLRHLDNPIEPESKAPDSTRPSSKAEPARPKAEGGDEKKDAPVRYGDIEQDYQLREALNLLKGIVIYRRAS